MSHIVITNRRGPNWWTPEKRQQVWDMYVRGDTYEAIAKEFGVSVASIQSQIYKYKKDTAK